MKPVESVRKRCSTGERPLWVRGGVGWSLVLDTCMGAPAQQRGGWMALSRDTLGTGRSGARRGGDPPGGGPRSWGF